MPDICPSDYSTQFLPLPSFQKVFHRHLTIKAPVTCSRVGSNQSPSPSREVYPTDRNSALISQSPSPPREEEEEEEHHHHHHHRHHIRRGMCHHPEGCGKRARRGGFCVSHGEVDDVAL